MLDMIQQAGFPSGARYNTVWNTLAGRSEGYGSKDVDFLYWLELEPIPWPSH